MEIDLKKEIRRAVDTGKAVFGESSSEKNVLKGQGQVVIVSNNAKQLIKERIKQIALISEIDLIDFNGTAKELGSVCGKPFPVQVMVVLDSGKSKIVEAKHAKKSTSSRKTIKRKKRK